LVDIKQVEPLKEKQQLFSETNLRIKENREDEVFILPNNLRM